MIKKLFALKWTFAVLLFLALIASYVMFLPFVTNWLNTFNKSFDRACTLPSNNSSCFVNKTVLQEKIRAGLPEWARAQIQEDLSKFKRVHSADLNEYHKQFDMLFRFQVKDGKLKVTYKDNLNILPAYKVIFDMLEYLTKNGYVANTDFLMGLGDYFQSPIKPTVPIFVFAKDLNEPFERELILVPDWMNLRDVTDLRARIRQANKQFLWEIKKPMLFWRGSVACSTGFREKIVSLALRYPELIDAKFVDKQIVKFVKPEEHLAFRYLISIDGIRCTWVRLVWHLHSNSLVFKHQSNQVQWFYKGIIPYVHYVPIKDENSLLESMKWAENHPAKVRSIIERSSSFVEQNLALEDMYHYFIVLLREYSKKFEQQ